MEEGQPGGYPFEITLRSPDHAVLLCLTGLSMYAQRTTDRDQRPQSRWREGDRITFYFTTPKGVELLLVKARQLLPADTWFVEGAPASAEGGAARPGGAEG